MLQASCSCTYGSGFSIFWNRLGHKLKRRDPCRLLKIARSAKIKRKERVGGRNKSDGQLSMKQKTHPLLRTHLHSHPPTWNPPESPFRKTVHFSVRFHRESFSQPRLEAGMPRFHLSPASGWMMSAPSALTPAPIGIARAKPKNRQKPPNHVLTSLYLYKKNR